MSDKVIALILAAGSGRRTGQSLPKQLVQIAGKTVLEHTLAAVQGSGQFDEIYLVIQPQLRQATEGLLEGKGYQKGIKLLDGGETRQESSQIAVNAVDDDQAKVLVHDAARPFLSETIIGRCIAALDSQQAVSVAIPTEDTIIRVDDAQLVREIPPRARMYRSQTPQGFRAGLLKRAHALAQRDAQTGFTDDCGLVLHYQLAPVYVVQGERTNLKITYSEDLLLAEELLQRKGCS